MSRRERSLDNPINWSFGIGRLFGVAIRVHVLFVLGALVVLAHAYRDDPRGGITSLTESLGVIGLLFFIVLIHEFGHCFGARRAGGTADRILLWPLGGLASVSPPHTPKAHLMTTLAGPLTNVALCVLTGAVLIAWTGNLGAAPWNPFALAPSSGEGFHHWAVQKWLVYFFGLSYVILLFNLTPVFPLDGGRVLQTLLWRRMGYRESMMLASGIGMIGAVGFGVLGIFAESYLLFAIAFFGYFTCWQQRQAIRMGAFESDAPSSYGLSDGYAPWEESTPGGGPKKVSFLARRRARKEEARRRREVRRIEEERRQVDAILKKISEHGLRSLTPGERRTLEEATTRQANESPRQD